MDYWLGADYGIFLREYLCCFSWSDYFTSFIERLGFGIPDYLTTSYTEAKKHFMAGSQNQELVNAWKSAPIIAGIKFIVDIPALIINALITWLVYIGIKESRNFNNFWLS